MRALPGVLLLLVLAGVAVAAPSDGLVKHSVLVGARNRTYWVHLPPGALDRKLPLVVAFHGGGGTGRQMARMCGFNAVADRERFIVVYPDGTGRRPDRLLTWNTWNCCGYALSHKVDDVSFVAAMLDNLVRDFPVDKDRVYATGMSNGGMMAHLVGCQLADRFAAIAPVAGALNGTSFTPSRPVSVMIFHGTADRHVKYAGGRSEGFQPRRDRSVPQAVSFWVGVDGCSRVPQRDDRGKVLWERYRGGRDGSEVVLCAIRGMGHAWPGGVPGTPWADPPSPEVSATEEMWKFFSAHSRVSGR